MRQEHVILLNEQDQPCGTLEKYAAHTATTPCTPLSRAGYLTSRANCWSPAARCTKSLARCLDQLCLRSPAVGRNQRSRYCPPGSLRTGCRYQLAHPVYADFRYRATDPSGIVENEVCPVYAAHIVSELQLNPDEVMDCQWSNLENVLSGIDATPWAFSPWMVMQVANKEARALLQNYCQQIIA